MARVALRCPSQLLRSSSLLTSLTTRAKPRSSCRCHQVIRKSQSLSMMPRSTDSSSKSTRHPHASTAIFSAEYFSSQNLTSSQDSLVNKIEHAKGVEELFHLIGTNKAKLTENHIAQAFFVLVALRQNVECQKEFCESISKRPEFRTLCDLAENRISTFDDVLLVNVLYCALKLLGSPYHSLVRELRCEGLKRVERLQTPQLSKMAVCLADLGERRGRAMGQVVQAYSKILDETKHLRELSTIMKETHALVSSDLKRRIVRKLKELLDPKSVEISNATCSDFRKVFMSVDKFTNDFDDVLHQCTNYMWKGLDNMSVRELCVLTSCVNNMGYDNSYLYNHLKDLLQGSLSSITDPVNMALMTELLGYHAPAHIKFQLEENALRLIDRLRITAVGSLCSGLRRMGYFSRTPLHNKLNDIMSSHADQLNLETLVPVVEYFRHLVWMEEEHWQPHTAKIYELTMNQLSPSQFLRGFYILSLIPTFQPNEKLFLRALCVLPQLHTAGTNSLFRAMKRMAGRNQMPEICLRIMQAVQDRATRCLHKNTSANYLTSLLHSVLTEGGDIELVDALFKQLSHIAHKIEPRHAVECARSLYKTRYFSQELMDRILEVTIPNIHKVTPMQVLYLLGPFCSLNYQPKRAEDFFRACTERVVPFMEELPSGFLVDMAHLMSYSQWFPDEILRRIFSLEFLTKLDEELDELPDRCDMYRRRLMYLNRTVALECPELQVPWFHEEYCQEILKKRNVFYHPDVQEVQKNLVEVLGGAQFLRSFVTTPYHYDITFECVLDVTGEPLSCVNYGSVLDKGKGLSGTVLSDLMQWDTQRKQLPDGAQRVAVDYMFSSAYCVNSGHMLGMSTMKKRHLELLGYQYIQIPYFEWKSLALTDRLEKEEYLRMKIFSSSSQRGLLDVASAPSGIHRDDGSSIFAPFLHGKRRLAEDNIAERILRSYDRLAKSSTVV